MLMNWQAVEAIGTCITALIAAGGLAFAYWQIGQVRKTLEQNRATHSLSALKGVILQEYSDREFKAAQPPFIVGEHGDRITHLRAARTSALKEFRRRRARWEEASRWSEGPRWCWQNRVGFEIADALENLGLATLIGAVPLPAVVALVGDVIVDDWLLSRSWVRSYREDGPEAIRRESDWVPFHRRHAEWLTLTTILWMRRRGWEYPRIGLIIADYHNGWEGIRSRLRAYSRADEDIMPDSVRDAVRDLTGEKI